MRLIGYRMEYSDISKIVFFSERQGRLHKECTITHHVVHNKLFIFSDRWCHSFFIEHNWKQPVVTDSTLRAESGSVLCSIARKSGGTLRAGKSLYEMTIGNTLIHAHVTHDPDAKETIFSIGHQTIGLMRTPPKSNRYPSYQGDETYGTVDFVPGLSPSIQYTLLLTIFCI